MTKIKICGLSRKEDISYANKLKPDYIGFVFAKKSRRFVTPELAKSLSAELDGSITPVGVFVNEPVQNVLKLFSDGVIDAAQLHGQENEDYITLLQSEGIPVIKAFKVKTAGDAACAAKSCADCILLDNGDGGTGKTFDWSLSDGIDRPFFLAGGLNAENVRKAISAVHPCAVDTSSGVETDNLKDFAKMEQFIKAVRSIG